MSEGDASIEMRQRLRLHREFAIHVTGDVAPLMLGSYHPQEIKYARILYVLWAGR